MFFSKTNNFYFNPYSEAVNTYSKHKPKIKKTRLCDVWFDISNLVAGYLAQKEVVLKQNSKAQVFVYQLPEAIITRIIKSCSKKDDLILDLFSHSATTSAMCIRLRRNYLAIEQDQYFIDEANKRLERERIKKKTLQTRRLQHRKAAA
ncbi:hypothetical protein LCGC14_2240150 [marine sediment metagenome]|uniref:DNA methylase N-4/N-6 domain-containing protein n=1 Tax=marine sediment metagenome TaxID=412755 RepID=A0A0F9G0P8_9ZZZZ